MYARECMCARSFMCVHKWLPSFFATSIHVGDTVIKRLKRKFLAVKAGLWQSSFFMGEDTHTRARTHTHNIHMIEIRHTTYL